MLLVKPCKQAEIDFYQTTIDHPYFKYYIPTFYGVLSLNQEATAAVASDVAVEPKDILPEASPSKVAASSDAWKPSHGGPLTSADAGIVLENAAYGFSKPNILDVKLGGRLWADDAPPAKRQRLDEVAEQTTSKPLGFRIAGMKVWVGNERGDGSVDANGYKSYGKHYGRDFKVDTVQKAFEEFFIVESAGLTRKLTRRVIKRFIADLHGLRGVLEKQESRMYSASLLFVYEGSGETLANDFEVEKQVPDAYDSGTENGNDADDKRTNNQGIAEGVETEGDDASSLDEEGPQLPKIQTLKMIDFAHAEWVPGQGPDENVLHGVRNVIKILKELVA